MFLCALVFVVTLFDAQIVNGDDYLAKSIRTNAKSETVKASRGVITDRNGKVLVSNRAVYTLNFDSSLVSSDELNDALLRVIELMNAQGVEIKDTLPLAQELALRLRHRERQRENARQIPRLAQVDQ